MKMKSQKQFEWFDVFLYSIITVFSVFILYPFYYVVINSINEELARGPAFLLPRFFTLRNYNIIFMDSQMINAFIVTMLRTVIGVIATDFVCATCAFALRKKDILFRKFYLVLLTIPVFFSGGLIPTYLNLKMFGLLDKFLVYIVPTLVSFFLIIILMTNFNEIPDALEESAKIDGAGYFTIFYRIYVPLSLPVLATISLFVGVGQWNSWFDSMYYTSSPRLITLPAILIRTITHSSVTAEIQMMSGLKDSEKNLISPEGIKMATMIVTVIPILFSYPFLQRYFVKGMMIGSIKG